MTPTQYRVDVALPLPIHRTFTYRVAADVAPAPGTRVLVPFRRDERIGWVVGEGSLDDIIEAKNQSVRALQQELEGMIAAHQDLVQASEEKMPFSH